MKSFGLSAVAIGMIASCCGPSAATAQQRELEPSHPRTCLVLGGGGARGAAHIGVLKVLERERVPIDCVVGTSMGAIVGGLYATGYSPDEIEGILRGIDWSKVLDDDPVRERRSIRRKEDDVHFLGGVEVGLKDRHLALPQGVVQGQQLLLLLRRLVQPVWSIDDFDRLPRPFRSVAADIVTGEKIVFERGDLALAIRASMSVPGAFAPIRVDGRLLVDGGMVDNVPIDEARKLGAQRLIVVAVGTGLHGEDELNSPMAIANQMITALMQHRTQEQLRTLGDDDLLIVPPLGHLSASSFDRATEAMDIGYRSADAATSSLRAYAVDETAYREFKAGVVAPADRLPHIAFVTVATRSPQTQRYLEKRMHKYVGRTLDIEALESDIGVIYGEGSFESIAWRITERAGESGLTIDAADKSWGPNFLRMGLELSDNFDGRSAYQLLGEARFTALNGSGGEALARMEIGRIFNVHGEFYQPFGIGSRLSITPYLDYRALNIPLRLSLRSDSYFAEIRRSAFIAGTQFSFHPDIRWQLSVAVESGHEDGHFQIGLPGLIPTVKADIGRVRPRLEIDTLDQVGFPSHGMRLDLSTEFYTKGLGSDESADATRLTLDSAVSVGNNRFLFGLQAAYSHGGDNLIGVTSKLGGLANFSGYVQDEVIARQLGLARVIYYRQLTEGGLLLKSPMYVGASAEVGGFWDEATDVSTDDLINAGSIFVGADTFLGPIFLGYGRAEGGIDAFYLRFGPLLRSELQL